ncbi:MAG: Coenzyme F420 hydrogenase/dehydrogenase, beta subunit C-terminal domain [Lachnospiraceae bacterium]|nr:Coenzyme F420 hydrogenase/dehydrogenase, beta subunit C-terminal domain [Lachnospiraceae bacterium]
MKIGIITLLGDNYGNRLQNYAVQELLNEYGEVYTVPYEKKKTNAAQKCNISKWSPFYIKKALDSRLLNVYHLSNRKMSTLSRCFYYARYKNIIKNGFSKRERAFREFDYKYIEYETEKLHLDGDDKELWVRSYDAWVCGSDQIWNPNYPTATRNAFLQFAQKERRIALAASIGLADVTDMPSEYKQWICEIPYLSVRENAAAKIVKTLTARTAEVFLDPTMILSKDKWIEMADNSKSELPEKFGLVYFLGIKEKQYVDYINLCIDNMGIDRVDVLDGEYPQYLDLAPNQIVAAIRKADIVFADSFHGIVFSIIFHKQFVTFERQEEGKPMNCRLETLLHKFGMEDRIYNGHNYLELQQQIDYSYADEIIRNEQIKVKKFLDKSLSEITLLSKESIKECNHIEVSRREKCSGCTACSQICPKQCIIMKEDEEGFVYPKVDESTCINCGKCKLVCPIMHFPNGAEPIEVLAVKNHDEKVRSSSSSGGVFYELAKQFVSGGLVCGCALDNKMVARHILVDNEEDLVKLKSSKYVQSDMENIMSEVKNKLIEGKRVLFSGTPCQVAGLKNYLEKDYENLFLIDVLCHGVPSPKLFRQYLELLNKKFGGSPVSVNFRNKQRGWKRLYMEVRFDNGKRHYIYSGYDRYEGLFLNNMSLRPACYECRFTKTERNGDITLGDFWGIGKEYPEWDDDKGISLVMINTSKGANAFRLITDKFEYKEESCEVAKMGQKTLYAPTEKNPNREDFYEVLTKQGCEAALKKYTKVPSVVTRAYYLAMRWSLDIVRKFLRKGY